MKNQVETNMLKVKWNGKLLQILFKKWVWNFNRTLAQLFFFSLVFFALPKIHPKNSGLIPFAKETNFGSAFNKMAQPTKST